MSKESRLMKNTLILSIGTIATKVISFLIVPLFSRKLSLDDYGQFDILYTYISLLVPIISLSVGEGAFRHLLDVEKDGERNEVVSNSSIIFLTSAVLGIVLVTVFTNDFTYKMFFLLLLIFNAIFEYLMYVLRGIKQLKLYTVASIIYMLFMSVVSLTLLYIVKTGAKGLFIGYTVGYIVAIIVICGLTKFYRYIDMKTISWRLDKKLILYSLPMIPNAISWWIANASDRTIINYAIGTEGNAIYAIANKIPAICTAFYSVFHLSWQQSVSEEVGSEGFIMFINSVFNKILIFLLTISSGILSINFLLFRYVFDSRYESSYYHVAILLTAVLFSTISTYIGGLFISIKKTSWNGSTTVCAAIVNIIINLIFVNRVGLFAASGSTLVAYVVLFVIRKKLIDKTYRLKISKKVIPYIVLYSYFIIMQYLNINIMNYINILFASVACLYGNKELVFTIIKKLEIKNKYKSMFLKNKLD